MTALYGDICPACRSHDILPYAVIVGGSEEFGYQCQFCQVTWPVLSYSEPVPSVVLSRLRYRALRQSREGANENHDREQHRAGVEAHGRSRSAFPPPVNGSRRAGSRR